MARVAFLQNMWYPYLSVMHISAILKKHGHECEIFIDDARRDVAGEIAASRPDIVAFSTLTGNHQWVLSAASRLKKKTSALILVGGAHPTYFPEMVEREPIDAVCLGEGEFAALDLANAIDNKAPINRIENLWVKQEGGTSRMPLRNLIQDLDGLPFPDRELYFKYKYFRDLKEIDFITGRGCPYQCSFCYNHRLMDMYKGKGRYVRKRSVENVIEEIRQVKRLFGNITYVHFQDDLMAVDKKWLFDFLEKYSSQIALPFLCSIRADLVEEDIVKALKEHGCFYACFGLESGNEDLRNKLLNKNIRTEQMLKAGEIFNKYKLKFSTTVILGLPGETVDQAFETINMNIKIGAGSTRPSLLQPYPGTDIYNYMLKNGFIDAVNLDDIDPSYFNTTVIKQKNKNELVNLHKLFYMAVRHPRLHFLIRLLIKLPPNPVFTVIFMYYYAVYLKDTYNQSWIAIIKLGVKNMNMFKKRAS